MTRAVLFDIDGTLVDTNDLHAAAWDEAFRKFGFEFSRERIRGQIGKGGDNLIPSLLGEDRAAVLQEQIEAYRGILFQRDYLPRAQPFDGVRGLFERLYADGIKIVLASSAKQAELEYHLSLIGAADLVSGTTSADDVESSKPCPDIFEAALAKVAPISAEDALVVGDTPWDMKAAGRAGMTAIGVLSGGFEERELREAGAAGIYQGPRHLLARYPDWLALTPA